MSNLKPKDTYESATQELKVLERKTREMDLLLEEEIQDDKHLKVQMARETKEYFDQCVKDMKQAIGRKFVFGLFKMKQERKKSAM